MRQVKPFSSEQLNVKLGERILGCIQDPLTHPSLSVPAILVMAALIQGESNSLVATRMATRFVDVLFGMVKTAKVIQTST